MPIECEICQQRPDRDKVTLFRVNATGEPGVWRCQAHLTTPVDQEMRDLAQILEEGRPDA